MKCTSKENSGEGMFSILEHSKVILHGTGKYTQVDLYSRGGRLFAEYAKGKFVKLSQKGQTTEPSILWDEVIHDGKIIEDGFGLKLGKK